MRRREDGLFEMDRDEILDGLRKGRTLNINRRDSPVLPIVLELEREGLVTTEIVQIDSQSSEMKVRIA